MKIDYFKDNLDNWIQQQYLDELSLNTLKQYKNGIIKFIQYAENNDIKEISKQTMFDYKEYLNSISESINSKNIWIVCLNKYLKYLKMSNYCLKQIKRQKEFSTKENMSRSDFKRLLRIAKRENMIQDYYIIKILAMTGIRISELKFFTVENLRRQNNNVLHIYNKGKSRDIPLRNDLARDLRKYCRENKIKSGSIFPSPVLKDKMINTVTIWKHLKKIAGIAKVKKKLVHAHSFRHLFAIIFLDTYPGNIVMLADLMGHESLETTRIYTEKSLNEQRKMISNMEF